MTTRPPGANAVATENDDFTSGAIRAVRGTGQEVATYQVEGRAGELFFTTEEGTQTMWIAVNPEAGETERVAETARERINANAFASSMMANHVDGTFDSTRGRSRGVRHHGRSADGGQAGG